MTKEEADQIIGNAEQVGTFLIRFSSTSCSEWFLCCVLENRHWPGTCASRGTFLLNTLRYTQSCESVYEVCIFYPWARAEAIVENLLYNLCPITEHSYGETLRYARTEKTQDLSQICSNKL